MMFHGAAGIQGTGKARVTGLQSSLFTVTLAVVVVLVALASRRHRLGEPFYRRPAAIVLVVVALIIVALMALLATRHGV